MYKNSEEVDEHQHKLKYIMHMDPIKDAQTGRVLEPSNLMLHNNESSLLFVDKNNRNCVVNFDLEKGKVVEKYDTSEKCNTGIKQLVNEHKNAQNTAAQLFHGVSGQNVFTIDPRLNSKSRVAVERPYKTNY